MKKFLLFLVAGAVVISVANSRSGTDAGTVARAGSAAVYQQIGSETSCSALQGTFDRADATAQRSGRSFSGERWIDIGIDYMDAADTRMRQIGCYR